MYEKKLGQCSSAVSVEACQGIQFLTTKNRANNNIYVAVTRGGARRLIILSRDTMKKRTLLII